MAWKIYSLIIWLIARFKCLCDGVKVQRLFCNALIIGFILLAIPAWRASASDDSCEVPGYLSEPEDGTLNIKHYHPTVAIVFYLRQDTGETGRGQITTILVPPANLGIYKLHSRKPEDWLYRRIHSHDGSGVLHVEPSPGRTLRMCQLLKLWFSDDEVDQIFSNLHPLNRVSVILSDTLVKEFQLQELLMMPLNNDRKIIVLIEENQTI